MKEQAEKRCRRCVYGREIPRERGGLIVCLWAHCPIREIAAEKELSKKKTSFGERL